MSNAVKIQLVRWCRQCEELLPRTCEKCKRHPDRRPRVVELFGVPPVLRTNACGCVEIPCQRPGCPQTKWVHPRADGTLGFKNHFCSRTCTIAVTNAARKAKRITAPCSCGCGRTVTRPASNMRAKHVYFSQKCHFIHRVMMKARARRSYAEGDDSVQAFVCHSDRCRGAVTDHTKLPQGSYGCVRCNARSHAPPMKVEMPR